MTTLLLKLFIKKHYGAAGESGMRTAIGKLAGMMGIVCNLLLTAGKLALGLAAGSVSIVADGINNLSDAASSVVTYLGFRLAQRPADKDHPFGHARYEYLAGLIVAALILLVGAELVKTSVTKIISPQQVAVSAVTAVLLAVSAGVKLWMMHFFRKLGRKTNSATLMAASVDSRNDVIATAAVLAGYMVNLLFDLNLDGIIGLAVALFVLYSGIGIIKDAISPLLGQRADRQLVEKITRLVLSHEKVLGIHDLLVHDYGPGQCYASAHVELSADEDALECHDIIDDIECDVLEELNVHFVIHYDPVMVDDEERREMFAFVSRILEDMDGQLSMHDFRVVRGSKRPKLVFDLSVPYSMQGEHRSIKQRIDEELRRSGKKYITVIRFDGEV